MIGFSKHPRGLHVLFFTEMWERFAYYLMLGIFVLYMTDSERNGLGFDRRPSPTRSTGPSSRWST